MRDGFGRPQTVLVLGGTSEIGRAVAEQLLPARGTIVLAGRDLLALKQAAEDLSRPGRNAETLYYDATAPAAATTDVLAAASFRHGDIDIVVICVGVLDDEARLGADTGAVEASLRTTMLGPMLAVHASAVRLRGQGHGTLVVLSSVAAVRTRPGLLTYGVAKTTLDVYARRIGVALRGSGVHVLVVRPGHVRTRMTRGLPEPPFTTTAPAVAAQVRSALRRQATVTYAPALLRPVMATLRLLPTAIFDQLTAVKAAPSIPAPESRPTNIDRKDH